MSEATDHAGAQITPILEAMEAEVSVRATGPLVQQINELQAQARLDAATISDLRKQLDEVLHPVTTRFGANPGGRPGVSAASVASITGKYPGASYARVFGGSPGPVVIVDGVLVHESFSCPITVGTKTVFDAAGVIAGKYDAGIRAAATTAGWATLKHEPEDDIAAGDFTLTQYKQAWARFSSVARAANPDVVLVLVLMAYTFNPKSGRRPDDYAGIDADVLGIDCDGQDPKNGVYPDWTESLAKAKAWATAQGMGLAIPEFGAPRDPSDTDGSKRAAWMIFWAGKFQDADVLACGVWDTATKGKPYPLTTEAELAAWRTVVGS